MSMTSVTIGHGLASRPQYAHKCDKVALNREHSPMRMKWSSSLLKITGTSSPARAQIVSPTWSGPRTFHSRANPIELWVTNGTFPTPKRSAFSLNNVRCSVMCFAAIMLAWYCVADESRLFVHDWQGFMKLNPEQLRHGIYMPPSKHVEQGSMVPHDGSASCGRMSPRDGSIFGNILMMISRR
jgi:hypothetical protein